MCKVNALFTIIFLSAQISMLWYGVPEIDGNAILDYGNFYMDMSYNIGCKSLVLSLFIVYPLLYFMKYVNSIGGPASCANG